MADISMDVIKELREETGVSVMQCKKALEEAGGDKAKAKILLQRKGGEIAAKKGDRTLGAGTIGAYIHSTKEVGAMVHLASETDFVSKNPEFVALAYEIAMHAAATAPVYTSRKDVPQKELDKVKATFSAEVAGKPAEMQEKILSGKVDAYFKDKILLEQPYIKDDSKTIGRMIEDAVQKFGERVEVIECVRLSVR